MARKYKIDNSDIHDIEIIASRYGLKVSKEKAKIIAEKTYAAVGRYSGIWDETAQKIIARDNHIKNPHFKKKIKWKKRMKLEGRCVDCGKRAVTKTHCQVHRDVWNAKNRERQKNRRETMTSIGCCIVCGEKAVTKHLCRKHQDAQNKIFRERYHRIKNNNE